MSQNTPFSANTVHSTPTVNTQYSKIPTNITINSTTQTPSETPNLLSLDAGQAQNQPNLQSESIENGCVIDFMHSPTQISSLDKVPVDQYVAPLLAQNLAVEDESFSIEISREDEDYY